MVDNFDPKGGLSGKFDPAKLHEIDTTGVGGGAIADLIAKYGREAFFGTKLPTARAFMSGIPQAELERIEGELRTAALMRAAIEIADARGGVPMPRDRMPDALRAHATLQKRRDDPEFMKRHDEGGQAERDELTELYERSYGE